MYCNTLEKSENNAATSARYVTPRADIYSTPQGAEVVIDLPGVSQENLEVVVEEQKLTVTGRRPKADQTEAAENQAKRPNDYRRVFSLAASIDTASIKAELRDGVLNLHLPFAEKVKLRRIAVA